MSEEEKDILLVLQTAMDDEQREALNRVIERARLGAAVISKCQEYSREQSFVDEDNIDKHTFLQQKAFGEIMSLAFDATET